MRKSPLGLRHLPQNNENYSVADDVATTTTTTTTAVAATAPPISQHRWTVYCVVPTNFSLCLSPSSQYWRKPYLFLWHIFGYCQLLSTLFASCFPPLHLTHSVPPLSASLSPASRTCLNFALMPEFVYYLGYWVMHSTKRLSEREREREREQKGKAN